MVLILRKTSPAATRETRAHWAKQRDFQVGVRHHEITVLFQIKPLGVLKAGIIAHGRRPSSTKFARAADDPPEVPLKM
jgi:hypothetical protein